MKFKFLISFALCCLFCNIAQAKTVDLGNRLSIEIPDTFNQNTKSSYKYSGASKDLNIYIHKQDVNYSKGYEMSKSKVFNNLDTLHFNLEGYELISKHSEPRLSMNEDYRIKQYNKGNSRVLTYTSYVKDVPYCILFQYNVEDNNADIESQIESIINSITYTGNIYRQGMYAFKLAGHKWIIFILLSLLVAAIAMPSRGSDTRKIIIAIATTIVFAIIIGLLTEWNSSLIIFYTPIILIVTIMVAIFGWKGILEMFADNA